MTPAEAAKVYLDYKPIADIISGPLREAEKVLKAHISGDRSTYKGITTSSGGSKRLNSELVAEALGPKKLDECKVWTPSTSLVLPPSLRKGAVDLRYTLVPAGTPEDDPVVALTG